MTEKSATESERGKKNSSFSPTPLHCFAACDTINAIAAKFASFVRGGDKECYSLLTQGIHGAAALLAAVDGFPDYAEVASVYQTIVFDALREIYRLLDGNI